MKKTIILTLFVCITLISSTIAIEDFNYFFDSEIKGLPVLIFEEQVGIGIFEEMSDTLLNDIIKNTSELKTYLDFEPINMLDNSLDFSKAFGLYLKDVNTILTNSYNDIVYMEYKMGIFKAQEENCWSDKKYYEEKFKENVKGLFSEEIQSNMNNTILAEQCATYGRINYNAYNIINQQASFYYKSLNRKYEYWLSNKQEIIDNREFYYEE